MQSVATVKFWLLKVVTNQEKNSQDAKKKNCDIKLLAILRVIHGGLLEKYFFGSVQNLQVYLHLIVIFNKFDYRSTASYVHRVIHRRSSH